MSNTAYVQQPLRLNLHFLVKATESLAYEQAESLNVRVGQT
jgi:hypothetical protein